MIFIVLSVVPLIIVGIISYTASFNAIKTISVDSYSQVADQLNKSINLLFLDSEKFLKIGNSKEVIDFIRSSKDTDSCYRNAMQVINLFKMYRNIFDFSDSIKGIYIIGFNGNNISEKRGVYNLQKDIRDIYTVQRIISNTEKIYTIPNTLIDYGDEIVTDSVISIGRVIRKPVTYDLIGVIIVDLDSDVISNLCKDLSDGPSSNYYIIEDLFNVVYPPGYNFNYSEIKKENIEAVAARDKGYFISGKGRNKEFVVFNTLERTGWKIISSTDYSALMNNALIIRNITVSIFMLCISFLLVINMFISDSFTKPILDLQKKMKEAENGNLEVFAESSKRDEIADLCGSFNLMIKKIKDLIILTLQEQEELKKYELKALQSQINPHFLYNSLDAIVWMSEAGNKKEVIKITKTLSNFFRISLSKGEDWITIADEIEHVRSYLTIQKMRYRDILDYSIDVPAEFLEYTILKITIQPLVENALYHGIKNCRRKGHIRITCEELYAERLLFKVRDDGAGMDKDRLKEINNALENNKLIIKSKSGLGLKNINQRIRLFYGKDFGLRIRSIQGKGTTAEIVLPKRR